MSVDWYSCKKCGRTFPDCGHYVHCECGEHWCSDECAEADGYEREYCKLGCDIFEQYLEDDSDNKCIGTKDEDGEINCYGCPNYVEESCKYCRSEDYDDETLLDKALNLLGMSREELINRINKDNGRN
jgi:hypothetical protein